MNIQISLNEAFVVCLIIAVTLAIKATSAVPLLLLAATVRSRKTNS